MALPFVPKIHIFLFISSLFLFSTLSLVASSSSNSGALEFHKGPILSGNVDLALIWYGRFGRVQKNVIRSLIKSLNSNGDTSFEPQVSKWWSIIEGYQSAANIGNPMIKIRRNPSIQVKVVKQVTDTTFSSGKILTKDFLPALINKATGGNPNVVAVVFAARDVTVQGTCMGQCSIHGAFGKQVYMVVGNPESECPSECAWPFYKAAYGPQGVTLQPPNSNVGADAMAMNFASALAATVTNPYNTGFFTGPITKPKEAASACPAMFGSGAFPGFTGKVRVDPRSGGAFNAHGVKGKKFLLPAIWNPKTSSCWTIM